MRSPGGRSLGFELTLFVAIGLLAACDRSTSPATTGTGGSGGNSATGGVVATGGRTGSGGATQSGGATGTDAAVDAAPATGGNSSSGGRTGAGGSIQQGGATGTGGAVDADLTSLQATLAAAIEQWKAAKKICPAYRYERGQWSVFGSCSSTAVVIANDQPIARSFVQDQKGCTFDGGAAPHWEETGSTQIGSHSEGSPARTVEQLLEECRTILGEDPSKNKFRLTVNPGGVPTTCVRTMNNCFDDCTVGIQITSFSCDAPSTVLDASAG